ncbi:MAG: Gfo/Idh/MocA family protein [Candidatus Spyradocola sp.]
MAKIRTALIGCGGISKVHLEALSKMDNVELVSVADIREERAKARAEQYGCAYTTDWQEYVSRDDIDVVHICTPHYLHAPMAIALLDSGKRVLTEKPIASEVADAEEMIRHADGRLAVVFQNRYNDASQFIRASIADGRYGKLLSMRAAVNWHRTPEYYTSSGWRGFYKTEGGGVLINQAIHTLDLMLYFAGKPASVRGHVSTDLLYDTIEVEDTACGLIKFESGLLANFYCTTTFGTDRPVEIELVFEHATLKTDAETLHVTQNGGTELICTSAASGEKAYWGVTHEVLLRDFYKAVEEKRPFWIDGESALPVLKLLKGVYESSRTGKEVQL